MKPFLIITTLFFLSACKQGNNNTEALQKKIDSLQAQIADAYKPGLGEFMSAIQVHHGKLWFAGISGNWKLADFEMQEITESLTDIKKHAADRPEVASIGMIDPAIDSMTKAIADKNPDGFKRSYAVLTNTCNNCHTATHHEFNVIKVPDTPPFSNQDYQPKQ